MSSTIISQLDNLYPVVSTECCSSILDELKGGRHTQNVDIKEGDKCIPHSSGSDNCTAERIITNNPREMIKKNMTYFDGVSNLFQFVETPQPV
jgi:hypothetical protein